ncbi:MAG: hypothetical protein H7125_00340 [Proteobacteria bacterium]|nr:hypothetical protein [Burkholderiales bacterium]
MRIVIEIDGTAVKHEEAGATTSPSPPNAAAASDGGAAPGADAMTAAADKDSGGPSQELLDSIGTAERGSGNGSPPAEAADAGAAPTDF